MKCFVIYSGTIQIAVATERWLVDIFKEQRQKIIKCDIKKVKYKDSHGDIIYRDDYLIYRNGYILTNKENEFVDKIIEEYPRKINLHKLKKLEDKISTKRIKQIKAVVRTYNDYLESDLEKQAILLVLTKYKDVYEYMTMVDYLAQCTV